MPTASQCQILNSLVARETRRSYTPYVLDEAEPDIVAETEVFPLHGTPTGYIPAPTPVTPLPELSSSPLVSAAQADSPLFTRRRHPVPLQGPGSPYHGRVRSGETHYPVYRSREHTDTPLFTRRKHPVPVAVSESPYHAQSPSLPQTVCRGEATEYPVSSKQPSQGRVTSGGWGRARTLFAPRDRSVRERHREMTTFQQQCMENIEKTLVPSTTIVHDLENLPDVESKGSVVVNILADMRVKLTAEIANTKPEDTTSTPQRAIVRFDSNVEVLGQLPSAQSPQITSKPLGEQKPDTDNPGEGENAAEGGSGNGEENKDDVNMKTPIIFPLTMKLPIEVTDEMKARLFELGWRKPFQRRQKKKETSKLNQPTVDLSNLPALMDLKKDPVLRKARKARVVPIQTKPPELNPTAVCFNMLGSSLTHRDVWFAFKKDILSEHPEVKVTSIQFIPRAIFVKRPKGGDPIEDRWVITFTSEWFRNRVSGMEINFKGGAVQLRRYDDVVTCEYRQYTRMTDYMKMVNMKK